MRYNLSEYVESCRITTGPNGTQPDEMTRGAFLFPNIAKDCEGMQVIMTQSYGWEHVSVSPHVPKRTPTWAEMDKIKRLFWGDNESAYQIHPPISEHVNIDDVCLHIWKPTNTPFPNPPKRLVY